MASDRRDIILQFAKENRDVPELQFINDDPEGIKIKEIGEIGYINYIYRVQSSDGSKSVVLKYGETTMKNNQEEEISLDRQKREYDSLILLQNIIPDNGVKPYCHDPKHNIVAMEDLSDMELLGSRFLKGNFDSNLAMRLGEILGTLHKKTTKERVDPDQWQQWMTSFGGKSVGADFFQYVQRMFVEEDTLTKVTDQMQPMFHQCMQDVTDHNLIQKLFDLYQKEQCFIHADCHCQAVFVKDDKIKLFDFEFVMLGHGGQNLALLAMCYPMWACVAGRNPSLNRKEVHKQAKQAFVKMVESYMETRDDMQNSTKQDFIKDLGLLCGSSIFLFTNLADAERIIELTEDDKIYLMEIGTNLMKHGSITTVDKLAQITFPGPRAC